MTLIKSVQEIVEETDNPLLNKHESWERIDLKNIATILNGFAFKSKFFNKNKGFPIIRIRDVGKDHTDAFYTQDDFNPLYIVKKGALIVGMDGDFKSAFWTGPDALLNQRVCRITVDSEHYSLKFLELVLPGYLEEIHKHTSAVTVKHLSSNDVYKIPLPLPPLNEQARIVSRVEKFFSQLDTGVRSLQAAQTHLDQNRQTTLKQAYTGKLTEKWRSDNEVNDDFIPDKHHYLSDTLSESLRNGKSAKVSKTGKGTPILSLSAVTFNDFSESNVKICDLEVESTSDLWVKPGDFLIARSNTIDYVGLGALYHGPKNLFIFPDLMIRARFNNSLILPKFVQYYFESKIARKYFKEKARGTSSSMPKINQTTINELRIPLPSIEEQKKVIELIEENITKLNYIKLNLHRSIRYAERLRSSILSKAFDGSLVPQDYNDEHAQVLLERIKSLREKQRKLM